MFYHNHSFNRAGTQRERERELYDAPGIMNLHQDLLSTLSPTGGADQRMRNPVLSTSELEIMTTAWIPTRRKHCFLMVNMSCIISHSASFLQLLLLTKLKQLLQTALRTSHRVIGIRLVTALQAERILNRVCGIASDGKRSARAWDNQI